MPKKTKLKKLTKNQKIALLVLGAGGAGYMAGKSMGGRRKSKGGRRKSKVGRRRVTLKRLGSGYRSRPNFRSMSSKGLVRFMVDNNLPVSPVIPSTRSAVISRLDRYYGNDVAKPTDEKTLKKIDEAFEAVKKRRDRRRAKNDTNFHDACAPHEVYNPNDKKCQGKSTLKKSIENLKIEILKNSANPLSPHLVEGQKKILMNLENALKDLDPEEEDEYFDAYAGNINVSHVLRDLGNNAKIQEGVINTAKKHAPESMRSQIEGLQMANEMRNAAKSFF